MIKILKLMVIATVIGYIIDCRDRRFVNKKEKLFTFALILMLVIFAGLRTWYNDTVTYIQIYEQTLEIGEFWSSDQANLAAGLGFGFLNSLMKTVGVSTQNYIMFYSIVSVVPIVWFVRKYSVSNALSFFFLFATGYYIFTLAAIKQSAATAIALVAVACAIEYKWTRYLIFTVVAIMIHPYAVVYLLVPLMTFKPWSGKTLICMCVFIISGFVLEHLLGAVIDVTTLLGAEYTMESFTSEGINVFRVLVAFVPLIISFLYGPNLFKDITRSESAMFNLAMLNALIMFVGLFGTANYFARLANYFLPFQALVIPWVLEKSTPNDKKWLVPVSVVCYIGYLYYEHGILRPFDLNYSSITIMEYFSMML